MAQITDMVIDSQLEMISMTVTSPVENTAEAPVAENVVQDVSGAELFTWWKCNLELRGSIGALNNLVKSLLQAEQILVVDHLEWSVDEEQGEYKITMSILF